MQNVWDDEIAAAESWLGAPFPATLTALWAERGHGAIPGTRDVVLGPFEVVDAMVAPGGALPFVRTSDGTLLRMDRSGRVVDRDNAVVAEDAMQFVAGLPAKAETVEEGSFRRVLRSLAGAMHLRDARLGSAA